MSSSPSVIERAFTLARSGSCRTADEIARRLKGEGFAGVDLHLASASLRKQLRELCGAAAKP